MKIFLTAWLCLFAFLSAVARPKAQRPTLVFTNVNVVNTRSGGIESGVTVVITKDRIVGVGKVGFVPEGRNIQIINIRYSDLVEQPQIEAARVSSFLDGRVEPGPMANSVDPSLYRNRKPQT